MKAGEDAQGSFGNWLRQRRRALDLTQAELAQRVGCSMITLRKLEAETRRPSKQIAERLADVLGVAADDRAAFLKFARGDPFAAPGAPLAAPSRAPRHNLPIPYNRFVGRQDEMAEVTRLVSGARLVTLTGMGGTGKTRLALQVARGLLQQFPDGVWLAQLAPLDDPALVAGTVASLFGLKEETTQPLLDTLIRHVQAWHGLLVLDSCEHLVESCAQLAAALLQACPAVFILATSRENLGVPSERSFVVPPLSTPDLRAPVSAEALQHFDAVQLFVERAEDVSASFAVTDANAVAIAQVCERLDGLPLAIELAAAQLRLLPVEQLAARLDHSWRLLTEGNRAALPRHRALQASLDWSYALLTPQEQVLLARLAVFAGSWTLPAAEAVGAGEGVAAEEVLGLLTHLVNKSLVFVEIQASEPRYRLLDTIRHYARAKLVASGEADGAWQRQARFYLALVQASEAARPGSLPLRSGGLKGLEREHDNLRAALAWTQSGPQGAEEALRLASALDWFWFSIGRWHEAQGWLEGAIAHPRAAQYPHALAQALESLGTIMALQGDYAAGQAQLARSLRLYQELRDPSKIAWLLNRMGWLAREHGDITTARERLEQSLALYRDLSDPAGVAWSSLTLSEVAESPAEAEWAIGLLEASLAVFQERRVGLGIAWARNHLGHMAQLQGDHPRAAQWHESSLLLFRELGESLGVASAYYSLGDNAIAAGDGGAAAQHYLEAIRLFRDLGDRAGVAWCLAGLAGAGDDPARAAWLWGVAEALRQSIGAREPPAFRATRDRLISLARDRLGEPDFAQAWAAGRAASAEQAIDQILGSAV